MFCMFIVHGKNFPEMAPNGARRIFSLLIQTSPTVWAERIWILRIFIFLILLDPKFLDFQVPDFQNLAPGRAWAMLEPSGPARALLRGGSAVAPRHSRTTKCGRSKELGQYRENPISASPVWGMKCFPYRLPNYLGGIIGVFSRNRKSLEHAR